MTELLDDGAELERLGGGAGWSEGPCWIPSTRTLRWSDITGNRILQWDAATGATSVYADRVEYTNGRTLDRDGSVIQCSHGRRRVERDRDGEVTPLVERWEGGRFNSPNDVVVASDGAVWFTDPPYGIDPSGKEGHPGTSEYGACYVFRLDPATGEATPVVTDLEHPNGLAFSPDESLLYVADTAGARNVRVYPVDGAGCGAGRDFAEVRPGMTDGMRIDAEGRMWSSGGDAVQVLSPEGEVLLRIPVPEVVSNVCFGGDDGRDLFITATTSLYRIRTATTAVPGQSGSTVSSA